jgi:photosystem II stability/assembly factor-like uncharacterized protein
MKRHLLIASTVFQFMFATFSADSPATGPTVTEAMLKGLKARSIGPAVMGGRVSDIALDPKNPYTFYIGLATGGLWKTGNNGASFEPLFDDQPVQSIGAVAVAPSDSDIVWVGTGEGNDRNSSGWGNGVYVSTNAGSAWQHVGLTNSRAIRRIVVHPGNPGVAYVAAAGSLWAEGGERGLYKTTDAGKTWKLILSAPKPHDALTGCADVVMDPQQPDTLYAALYARLRRPWGFYYGTNVTGTNADVGGIFKSTDGGSSWSKLTNGLPTQTGRIGLAVSASKPDVVMAVVQSDEGGTSDIDENHSRKGGIFRSEDRGATWTRVNSLNPRPFYFSNIRIDPANDQRVYVLGWLLFVSDDAGRTFREDRSEKVHVDHHALAIQAGSVLPEKSPKPGDKPKPAVSQRLIAGTDGGVYQTFDAGATWSFLNTMPAAQYYRIELDASTPYRIAGGMQDNCNWVGPSRTYSKEGIRNSDWTMIGGGDGFYCVFDPDDADVIYAESQGGHVHRFNARTGEVRVFAPKPTEGQPAFRFQWNSPLIGSRHRNGVMYLAGNRIFKLTNRAEHFEIISPDLSYNEPDKTTATGSTAENYAVVYSLAESPLKADRLFAGTDDGRLWFTDDEGKTWTELTEKIPAEARGKWIGRIEPSQFDAGTAYVVFTGYRAGDDQAYIYRMTGLGKDWTRLSGDLPASNPVYVVREDPVNRNLLFAGTEFGLYVSVNGGANWIKLGGLPAVRVDDLKIQARESDLVIATHGRSLYVLDDIRPLRELTPEIAAKPVHLFSVRPAHGKYLRRDWEDSAGKGWFKGENPPEGVLLTVWCREFIGERYAVTISNAHNQPLAKFEQVGTPGFTRLNWDLRVAKEFRTEYGGDNPNRFVPAGDYTAELSYKDTTIKQTFPVTVEEGIATYGSYR